MGLRARGTSEAILPIRKTDEVVERAGNMERKKDNDPIRRESGSRHEDMSVYSASA